MLAFVLICLVLAACGGGGDAPADVESSEPAALDTTSAPTTSATPSTSASPSPSLSDSPSGAIDPADVVPLLGILTDAGGERTYGVITVDAAEGEYVTTYDTRAPQSSGAIVHDYLAAYMIGADDDGARIVRVDLASGEMGASEPFAESVDDMDYGFDSLWVTTYFGDDGVGTARLDPADGTVIARLPLVGGQSALAVGDDGVWVGEPIGDARPADQHYGLVRIDPGSNEHDVPVEVDDDPYDTDEMVATPASIWFLDAEDGPTVLRRLDTVSGEVSDVFVAPDGTNPTQLASDGANVYLYENQVGEVIVFSAADGTEQARVALPGEPNVIDMGFARGLVWVAAQERVLALLPGTAEVGYDFTLPEGMTAIAVANDPPDE